MLIRTDENLNIIQLITVGCVLPNTPNYYQIEKEDITDEIIHHILDYQYINNQFVLRVDQHEKREKVLETKLTNMRMICNQTITYGIDYNNAHYSLSDEDQMNLTNLSLMAQSGVPYVPYHADGQLCRMYSAEEIIAISQLAIQWITFHTTYYNFTKSYLKNITDMNQLIAFQYGMPLSEYFMTEIQTIMGGIDITPFMVQLFPDPISNYSHYMIYRPDLSVDTIDFSKAIFWDPDEHRPEPPSPEPDPGPEPPNEGDDPIEPETLPDEDEQIDDDGDFQSSNGEDNPIHNS